MKEETGMERDHENKVSEKN